MLIIPPKRYVFQFNIRSIFACILFFSLLLTGCQKQPSSPGEPTLAKELVLYNWEGDMPQSVLDAFSAEYGVRIGYLVYESQEEAIEQIRLGQQADVMVMDSRFIPLLKQENLLQKLEYQYIPNFKNVSPNFRGLIYDPENNYSVPYSWGATGLVVRTDLVDKPITHWTDLWNPIYQGKTGIWIEQKRELISLALKALGFSANSENPEEIQAATEYLIALKPTVKYLEDYDLAFSAKVMASGSMVLSMGYAGDVLEGKMLNPAIDFVYPEDGALLWGDTFVVPITTHNQYTAELFINYLLRPEVAAEIANNNFYAPANEAAIPLIDTEIRNNPVIFPPLADLQNAEILLPLSQTGEELFNKAWEQFYSAEAGD